MTIRSEADATSHAVADVGAYASQYSESGAHSTGPQPRWLRHLVVFQVLLIVCLAIAVPFLGIGLLGSLLFRTWFSAVVFAQLVAGVALIIGIGTLRLKLLAGEDVPFVKAIGWHVGTVAYFLWPFVSFVRPAPSALYLMLAVPVVMAIVAASIVFRHRTAFQKTLPLGVPHFGSEGP